MLLGVAYRPRTSFSVWLSSQEGRGRWGALTPRLEPRRHPRPFRRPPPPAPSLSPFRSLSGAPRSASPFSASLSPTSSLFLSCRRSLHTPAPAPPARQPPRRGRGSRLGAWPGGAGLGWAGPRAGARGGGGQLVDGRYWSRSASRAEAAARGGGSRAGRLHGASGACLSSAGSGRRRPDRAARLLLTMGDVLSTHLDDARRQHIAGESGATQRALGVRRGAPATPPSLPACWGLRRVRPRAGREWPRAKNCCTSLFLLRLGAPSWLLLSPPFPLPRGLELPPTPGSRRVSGFLGTLLQPELWKRVAASPLHLGYLCPEAIRAHSASVS